MFTFEKFPLITIQHSCISAGCLSTAPGEDKHVQTYAVFLKLVLFGGQCQTTSTTVLVIKQLDRLLAGIFQSRSKR